MNSPFFDSTIGRRDHSQTKSSRKALLTQLLFVIVAFILLIFFRDRAQFHTLGIIFVSIVLEALPFMLLGTFIGGFIEVFIPAEKITQWIPEQRWWTVFIGAGFGLIFPVCECAIVPVVRRLLHKGVPLSAAIAFLTTCLPAIIYITWLDAYYWLLEGGRYKAFIQPKLWPLLILALLLLLAFTAAFISQFSLKSKISFQFVLLI